MGGLYARAQELDPTLPEATRFAIADAIYDHYKPESTEDEVPRSIEGAVLSIGDKADTIAGMFSLGVVPSGSKDPFALRRQANGIVRIIAEKKLPLHLSEMMRDARAGYRGSEAERKFVDDARFDESVKTFFRERLEFYLKDVCGYAYDVVKAVLATDSDDVVDVLARAQAVKVGFAYGGIPGDWGRLQTHTKHLAAGGRKRDQARRGSLNIWKSHRRRRSIWRLTWKLTDRKLKRIARKKSTARHSWFSRRRGNGWMHFSTKSW